MEYLKFCPVCHETSLSQNLQSRDYFLTQEPFNIVKCENCGLLFTNPRPTESDSTGYYESEEYLSHNQKEQGSFSKLYQFVRTFTLKTKLNIVKKYAKGNEALDIGCGTGEFLHVLENHGYKVFGIEPNQSAREFASSKYKLNVSSNFLNESFNSNSINIISMWHVLEHVYHLDKTITKIKDVLSANGILIVALPNPAAYDANRYGKFWAAYDLPRHLYHFKSKQVKILFDKYGFELVKIKPMYFDAFYVSLLSEKYKSGSMNYAKAILTAVISNLKAFFGSGNYSSLIYIFKPKKD